MSDYSEYPESTLLHEKDKRIAELEGQKKEWLYGALVKRNAVLAEQVEELKERLQASWAMTDEEFSNALALMLPPQQEEK